MLPCFALLCKFAPHLLHFKLSGACLAATACGALLYGYRPRGAKELELFDAALDLSSMKPPAAATRAMFGARQKQLDCATERGTHTGDASAHPLLAFICTFVSALTALRILKFRDYLGLQDADFRL